MRRHTSGRGARAAWRLWAAASVLAAVAIGLLLGRNCGTGEDTAETAIPDDRFAAEVSARLPAAADAGFDDAAEPVMMLKIACLTFDDGPSRNTARILETLAAYDAPATFFVTAQDANLDYLPLLTDIQAQGHQIALHSATHDYSKIYAGTDAFWLDIKELRQQLAPYVDVDDIRWLRFPGGSTNTVSHKYGGSGIMKKLIAQTAEKGYNWIDWNVCGEDATASHPNAARILQNIQRDAAGRDVCVVLLHDTRATGETVKALPSILEWFRDEGYHFCTIEQMYEQQDGNF